MISIIISSARPQLLQQAKANIANTIGVPFELLTYNNGNAEKGICEIYNQGARDAQYSILCYMHEDLEIKTQNWGNLVLDIFNAHHDLGVVGVAGSSYKSYAPAAWNPTPGDNTFVSCNYIQSFKQKNVASVHYESNIAAARTAEVICVDGMWFCTPKHVALLHPFDQVLLKGFHCYDIDYCLSLFGKYKVFVTSDVLLEHFSEGHYDCSWLQDTLSIHEKWQQKLPLSLAESSAKAKLKVEKTAYKYLIKKFVECRHPKDSIITLLSTHRREGKITLHLYLKLLYYVHRFYSAAL
jgi:hypothetical protein